MLPAAKTVCVTGASGFIGSWLIMRLLERGYIVRATVRDPENKQKTKHLLEMPKADTNLTIWKADLTVEGSFDDPIRGCEGVFHVATPMDFESDDPEFSKWRSYVIGKYFGNAIITALPESLNKAVAVCVVQAQGCWNNKNEVIKPTIEGFLSLIRSCAKAKTVKRLVFTSSAGAVNVEEHQKPIYDETDYSDIDFIKSKKMTGWMYFVSKTLAEKAGEEAAKANNMSFISIIPTLVVGPFNTPTFPPSLITALSPINGNKPHYSIIAQGQYVHLDDLTEAHIFLYEHPNAEGRYICSSHDATIYDLAKVLRNKWPEYDVPTTFEGIDKDIPVVSFSSKKLIEMGFNFKYTLEDMYTGAIETCREKGFLPYSTKNQNPAEERKKCLDTEKFRARE